VLYCVCMSISTAVIDEIKTFLSQCFDMKDLGLADIILNIKLIKNENGITLSQSHTQRRSLAVLALQTVRSLQLPMMQV
jgi:hypothetical protein